MNVEYTGRQYEITPAVRKQIEHGLAKIKKLLGDNFDTHVILAVEKHRHKAEITITWRDHPIVGVAESTEMTSAIAEALDRIDRQAVKCKSRIRTRKRAAKKKWAGSAANPEVAMAVGANVSTAVPVVVHTFPPVVRTTEAHIVKSEDSIALRPMTLEEAVKECEFRDRDVFVFRDANGKVKVLHRTKDGRIELIEAP
ncbi:MAG TPA: ribosome-associated translation inhibitor RaiA [Candidatus Angelobacter sp.]|nr:ribosome-associated translation inhibitor RaiA [Candidatus Angelobacter sp.]